MRKALAIAGLLTLFWSHAAAAENAPNQEDDLRRQISAINKKYINVINALSGLEKEIKTFANTILNISLVKPQNNFRLISIEILDNDQLMANHIYSPIEVEALDAGGRQVLYKAELRSGKHDLKISYVWASGDGSPKKGTVPVSLSAVTGKNYYIELSLKRDRSGVVLHPSHLTFDGQK